MIIGYIYLYCLFYVYVYKDSIYSDIYLMLLNWLHNSRYAKTFVMTTFIPISCLLDAMILLCNSLDQPTKF